MTNTKQELIAIRDGAPSGAWPVADEVGVLDGEIVYISNSDNGRPFKVYCDCDGHHLWCYGEDDADFLRIRNRRKLDDIRAQIELMEENEKLVAKVAELEREHQELGDCHDHWKSKWYEDTEVYSKRITELERERDEAYEATAILMEYTRLDCPNEFVKAVLDCEEIIGENQVKKMFESVKLEQQAKGVEDFVDRYCGTSIELEHEAVRYCGSQQAEQLRKQAGEI